MENQDVAALAYSTLLERVYVPTFLEKLASVYGVVPKSEQDIASLLETAGFIKAMENDGVVKKIIDNNLSDPLLKSGAELLKQAAGVSNSEVPVEAINSIANQYVSSDEDILGAALVLNELLQGNQ